MATRVVVLGAGFGGLEPATVVSETCGAAEYDGRGICHLEFGHDEVAQALVRQGLGPHGTVAIIQSCRYPPPRCPPTCGPGPPRDHR